MPISPTYPGVYVQELPSGVRTIMGVSTSTALFIGRTAGGPIDEPILCFNYTEFVRTFTEGPADSDMARHVRLFFLNGGTQAYVMRIAKDPAAASSAVSAADGATPALTLTSKHEGVIGNEIRAAVTYDTEQPESTFNLTLFRRETDSSGTPVKTALETWRGLSMDPTSPLYAPDVITQKSALVDASVAAPPVASAGFSLAGLPLPAADGPLVTALGTLFGDSFPPSSSRSFQISVGGARWVDVELNGIHLAGLVPTQVIIALNGVINGSLAAAGVTGTSVATSFVDGPTIGVDTTKQLLVTATPATDVLLRPTTRSDLASAMMLGTAQGGFEVGAYAHARPAPTGITFDLSKGATPLAPNVPLIALQETLHSAFTSLSIDGIAAHWAFSAALAAEEIVKDDYASSANGNNDGVRQLVGVMAAAFANLRATNPKFPWSVQQWGSRIAIVRDDTDDTSFPVVTGAPAGITFAANAQYYTLGRKTASLPFQPIGGTDGDDGTPPLAADYTKAYPIVDREVDLFNLMVLPPTTGTELDPSIWGPASAFCSQRRALLIMDAPSWDNVQAAVTGVSVLRGGLTKDYSAIFYPKLVINEGGRNRKVGPAGAIAGLMARIDSARGVWKAPAGTEADLRGIVGLERRFSDGENGFLNPAAINTLRIFPDGIVNWGARTNDGSDSAASQYKYIPVRRLALYIEESLYRGLKWVVFEPNDEPLWSEIRVNVGAFMQTLFRQGAFQGTTPKDAYFVKCDSETTTSDDQNRGIVNIWVGFAPLKPAEFVILSLQQMAGQTQV